MAGNVILKHQSLTISQQIEELRNWHKQQQSKLDLAKTPVKNNEVEMLDKYRDKNNTVNPIERLDYKQQHKNPASMQNFDDTPIKVVNTDLSELIENNINSTDAIHPNNEKPKFRYLKRGEGIARFRMGPQKIPKFGNKNKQGLNFSGRNKKLEGNCLNNVEKGQKHNLEKDTVKKHDEIPTLDPPDLKLNFKNWKSIFSSKKAEEIFEKAIDNNHLDIFLPNSSIDSSTASIIEKCIDVGKKRLREKEELHVFETIEQHVLDSSFCSTSSYVTKLMENAVISTPEKKSFSNRNTLSTNVQPDKLHIIPQICGNQENPVQNNIEPIKWTTQEKAKLPDNILQGTEHSENLEQSFHVRFAEEIDYKSFVEYSQCENSSCQKETHLNKEFDDSEEWKEESEEDSRHCSDCSTTYSSSDEDVRAISPPVKPPTILQNHEIGHSKYQSETQNPRERSSEELDIVNSEKTSTHNTDCTMSSNNGIDKISPVSNEKLKTLLENEIKMFSAENNKLKALREKLEKERKQFQLEKKKFLKEMEEDKKKITAQLEMEKQKLAKDKFTFEKYSKSLKNNPTKEERKEIQALKEQLNEMKEELNKKESRWGSAQARVRNQMKLLEEDNKKLREELENLRKKSKYLEFLTQNKKRKSFNNTKLIHAISDCISNIDVEGDADTVKSSSGGGYFNPKSNVKIVVVDEVDPKDISSIKVIREDRVKIDEKSPSHNGTNEKLVQSLNNKIVINEESIDDNNTSLPKQASSVEETSYNNKQTELPKEINLQTLSKGAQSQENPVIRPKEIVNEDGNVEKIYSDGRKEIIYKNGNVKKIDPLTGNEKIYYFNGDVKEIIKDGTVKYYYSESRIWHTTLLDGLEVLDFPNGQIEKRHTSGMVEIIYPDDCKKFTYPDGSEEIYYPDGRTLKIEANKRAVLSLPNGQKEIRTDEFTRREYPDGTVRIVYSDGTTETVYANGRVRLKDKHGNLVMDSETTSNNRL